MTALHEDFAELAGLGGGPGSAEITEHFERFSLMNVIEFGGAADHPTHVPAELGRVGPASILESTGAADQLPFWNTNYDGDAYLYIVYGKVRVEFKETDTDRRYGRYLASTGDLFRLPRDIAHRTFSGDGKRRITLEILPENPYWQLMGAHDVEPDPSGTVGAFAFHVETENVRVTTPAGAVSCPRDFFGKALRALSKHELHLGHNELDGGFTVHDNGETVTLSVPGFTETLDARAVLAVFRGLLPELV